MVSINRIRIYACERYVLTNVAEQGGKATLLWLVQRESRIQESKARLITTTDGTQRQFFVENTQAKFMLQCQR